MSTYPLPRHSRSRTYIPTLQRYAARVSLRSKLGAVSLANVLSGDTCSPISLADFEACLTFSEHSEENLQFIVWFQDYRKRFFALPNDVQAYSPGPNEFTFSVPQPARTARRITDSKRNAVLRMHTSVPPIPPKPASLRGSSCSVSFPQAASLSFDTSLPRPPSTLPSSSITLSSAIYHDTPSLSALETASAPASEITSITSASAQPFREECSRVIATFLRPGAQKELLLDACVRDTIIRDLTWNTHPNCLEQFLPAYEEVYSSLETTCLPNFLATASANINLPKQIFWYALGLTDISIAVIIAVALITAVPTSQRDEGHRALRLLAVPFAALGMMQLYSAWRGFCSHVWSRESRQLRVWEMQEMDEEAAAHWEISRTTRIDDSSPCYSRNSEGQTRQASDNKIRVDMCEHYAPTIPICSRGQDASISAIAPFADTAVVDASREKSTFQNGTGTTCRERMRPNSSADSQTCRYFVPRADSPRSTYKRPPIFGPEKVVLDPRIREVHRRVMRDIFTVGLWGTVIFTAVMLSVPGLQRPPEPHGPDEHRPHGI